MTESSRRSFFLALCALVLLHIGAHISQSYLNHPAWHVIEAESFKPYHWAPCDRTSPTRPGWMRGTFK